MNTLTIKGGRNRLGEREIVSNIVLHTGKIYTIVGNTGSGKSRLIKDIEQLVQGDSITQRSILLDETPVEPEQRGQLSNMLVAHLGQNMRFSLDLMIEDFLNLHAKVRGVLALDCPAIIETANRITQEPIDLKQNLADLSGGQSRALMVSDIAHICPSPIVLIDEIENAGIDKIEALNVLIGKEKLVLIVTHDPHTALLADSRLVLNQGGIIQVAQRTEKELELFSELEKGYQIQNRLQTLMRKGEDLE